MQRWGLPVQNQWKALRLCVLRIQFALFVRQMGISPPADWYSVERVENMARKKGTGARLAPQGSEGCRGLASGASLGSPGRPIHKGGSRVNRGLI
jgi:hypothetical protein